MSQTGTHEQRPSNIVMSLWVALVFGGVCLAVVGGVYLSWAIQERRWPTAVATVTHVNVSKDRRLTGSSGSPSDPTYWKVATSFRYTVNDSVFPGHRFRTAEPSQEFSDEASARARAQALKESGKVTVRYDPENPSYAVIEPQELGAVAPIIVGLMVAAAGGWLLRRHWRRRRAFAAASGF